MALAALLAASVLVALGTGVEFPFDRVLGTYENVSVDALPADNGAIGLSLSSPENAVTLEGGSLRLEPAEDGLHEALLVVQFSGEGRLVTEVRMGSFPASFEDRVVFPSQTHRIIARVSVEPEEEGYRLVAKELPETVQIQLESSRAEDLVSLCRRMSLFFAGDAACEGLDSMLSNPKIPLPKPGSDFLVRYSALTQAERERLDVYLAGSKI